MLFDDVSDIADPGDLIIVQQEDFWNVCCVGLKALHKPTDKHFKLFATKRVAKDYLKKWKKNFELSMKNLQKVDLQLKNVQDRRNKTETSNNFGHFWIVVLTVVSGILFARFPTVECIAKFEASYVMTS